MAIHTIPTTVRMSRFVALLGSAVTLVQIVLLASERQAICLNDGCTVVDSLTTIPPIFFNIGGFVFFQAVFWGYWIAGSDAGRRRLVNVILLAALAAEAVLVSFQHYVAQTFCSYCLIILAFVLLLNILAGLRHLVAAAVVFGAVLAAFASLQFSGGGLDPLADLDSGSYAVLNGGENEAGTKYLFFSSSCKYCEEIIENLDTKIPCTIRFNPIDEIDAFGLPAAERQQTYSPEINRAALEHFGVEQIPVLLARSSLSLELYTGAGPIRTYLQEHCPAVAAPVQEDDITFGETSGSSGGGSFLNEYQLPGDEACRVDVDCEDPAEEIPQQQ